MVGIRQHPGFHLTHQGRIHINPLHLQGSMTENRLTGNDRLEHGTVRSKQIGQFSNTGIHPFHKSREIGRIIDIRSRVRISGQRVVFGQKMDIPFCLVFCPHGRNGIAYQATPETFVRHFQTVGKIRHQQSEETPQLFRTCESGLNLILCNGHLVKIDRSTIKIGLQNVRLFDRPRVNRFTITGSRTLRRIICYRPCISRIILPRSIRNGQFPHHVPPAESIHFQTGHLRRIRTNGKNRSGQYVTDCIHNSITVSTQGHLCNGYKTSSICGSKNSLIGCLLNNTGQHR